jgi:hypothetical protein
MDSLLDVTGLRLENDRNQNKDPVRNWALDISSFRVDRSDRVFVIADNHHGKSALKDALSTILSSGATRGANMKLTQPGRREVLYVEWFWRAPRVVFREQGGSRADVESLRALELNSWVLNYADDPENGPDVIETAHERNLTLLIGSAPGLPEKRLQNTLGRFLQKGVGRILWLYNGSVFWEGSVEMFVAVTENLCARYDLLRRNPAYCSAGKDLVGATREAVRIAGS